MMDSKASPPPSPPSSPREEPPKVKDEKISLNKAMANRHLWLVKVPTRVAEKIREKKVEEEIGEVEIVDDKVTLKFRQSFVGALNEYTVNLRQVDATKKKSMVFSTEPSHCNMEGTVKMQGEMILDRSKDSQRLAYREMMKEKTKQSAKKGRGVVQIDDDKEAILIGKNATHRLYEEAERPREVPQTRVKDEKELRSDLFDLFGQKPRWSLKELERKTSQPPSSIKRPLADIANYHKKGEHRGLWELKPEYQRKTPKRDE